MQVEFSRLKRDRFGRLEDPVLILSARHGRDFGPLACYCNLKLDLKFNELSELSFDLPAWDGGVRTPLYDEVTGERLVRIDPYGVFLLTDPQISGDGVSEVKSCTAYSLEYELAGKQLVFGAGTYPLYDPIGGADSILSMALERTRHWKVGALPASLYGRYRTFGQTDAKVLDFLLDDVQRAYGCIFVFDSFTRTVNVVDAADETAILPIYLSFDNLLLSVDVNEMDSNLATRIAVSGADGVSIRNVNPTGTNELIDLGYAISQGDIPQAVARRYHDWENAVQAAQAYYTGLAALRNSAYARLLTEKARLTGLEGELAALDNLRSVNVQGRALATREGSSTEQGTVRYFDARLAEIAVQYQIKQVEISQQKALLEEVQAEYEQCGRDMAAVNGELRFERFFTAQELDLLDHYLIDGVFEDPSFATFDVDISGADDSFVTPNAAVLSFEDVKAIAVTSGAQRRILALTGGTLSVDGDGYALSAGLVSATLDYKDSGALVFSAYLAAGSANGGAFPSGNLTCVCSARFDVDAFLAGMEKITDATVDEASGASRANVSYRGGGSLPMSGCALYFTRNVTEYQQFTVEQELYSHAAACLQELAYPTYEFEVKSGNILWDQELEPLKNVLQLGRGVYLQLNGDTLLKPMILELHLDYEKPEDFGIVFSNQFQRKRPDRVNQLKDLLKEARGASRTLDLSKYEFGKLNASGAYSALEHFLHDGMDAAYQQITAGPGQSVVADASGLTVRSTAGSEYIKLANGMIALVDDTAKSARMALGHFHNTATGTDYFGVLADVIGGTLLAGRNLHMECFSPDNQVTQFKFDGTGAFLNNSRMYLQSAKGGRLGLDPNYGMFGGTSSLFTVTGTGYVRPSFIRDDGTIELDRDGFPKDANFWLGIDGQAYFRGNIYAKDGTFSGKIKAAVLDGKLVGGSNGGVIEGIGLNIGSGKFVVDKSGNATLAGNINMSGGVITWGKNIPNKQRFAASKTGPWHDTMLDGDIYCCDWNYATNSWNPPYPKVGQDGRPGANGSDANVPDWVEAYTKTATYIDKQWVIAPNIAGGKITALEKMEAACDFYVGNNIYIGKSRDNTLKMIRFHDTATIASPSWGNLAISAISLDLSKIDTIVWGNNVPVAVFAN